VNALYTRLFTFVVIIFIHLDCYSQDQWTNISPSQAYEVFKSANNWFNKNEVWSIKIKLETFAGHTSNEVQDNSISIVKKYKKNWYTSLMDLHTVQNEKIKLSIDSLEKIILISQADQASMIIPMDSLSMSMLESCRQIRMKKIESESVYKLDFHPNQIYDAIEVTISKDQKFKNMKLFLSLAQPLNPDDEKSPKAKPRLEMTFIEYKTNIPFNKKEFDVLSYIQLKDNSISLSPQYKNFVLKDTRFKR